MSLRPRPCEPNSGLSTKGPCAASRRTIARAQSCDSTAQVSGVGIPDRASRKLVVDLSTQRSIARASFQTRTPFSRKAWRMPSRNVTAWNVPPDIVRTNTASGRRSPRPAMFNPDGRCVSMAHERKLIACVRTPSAAKACASTRACQSIPSIASAMSGGAGAGSAAGVLREGGIEKLQVDMPAVEAFAAVDGGDDHLGRAEQHGIDGVEVALEALENLGKRPAVIARALARQRLGEVARVARRTGNEEMDPPGIDDGIVGAAHRSDEIGMRRREWCRAEALDQALQRKFELVRLVQRDLEHAGDHLYAAGEALRRRVDDGQAVRIEPAIARDPRDQRGRRRPAALDHQRGTRSAVAIVEQIGRAS